MSPTCPICHADIDPNTPSSLKIGESKSFVHNTCLRNKRREAETQNKILEFKWEGELCTSFQLVRREL